MNIVRLYVYLLFVTFALPAFSGPAFTTYQARIIQPNGVPLESNGVNFRFTILNPAANCILYVEDYSAINMNNTGGLASFSLGSGTKTYPTSGTVTFQDIFNNTTSPLACQVSGTYGPGANDVRKIMMQFNDGNGWQTLPAMSINAVPYAMYASDAQKLGGVSATSYVNYSTIPTCGASQALQYTGSGFLCITAGGGGASATITAGDIATALGYTPANPATLSTSYATAASYSTMTATVSSLGSSVTTAISTVNDLSASLAAIVSSQWLTSGTTISYNSGNVGIGTTTPVTKLVVSGGIKISMESATCAAAYAGTLRYNGTNVEYCDGTTWAAFGVAGAGITSFNSSTSATQSLANSLSGTTPAFVTNNGVHTLNIPYASAGAATAGLISNSDYLNFSNKITSSAAAIAQVLGYVPAASGALTFSSVDLGSASATGTLAEARLQSFASVTSGTQYTKVTVDGKGRVTSGAQLALSDVTTALGYTPASASAASQWNTAGATINYMNGYVGIGTATPSFKLELAGVSTTADRKIGINGSQVVYLPDQSNFTGSIFIGDGGQSLSHISGYDGLNNTSIGMGALYSNTTGYGNVANGFDALRSNTTGSSNIANGLNSLYSNTSGGGNIAMGDQALYSNTTADFNTAIGYRALKFNTTGEQNIATGTLALFSNLTGSNNVAYGSNSLYSNRTGNENVATGGLTLYGNVTGVRNVATGHAALTANQTKSESTAIGYYSMAFADSVSAAPVVTYNTAIGAFSLQGSATPANNTGTMNTALGHSALKNISSGLGNIGVGYNAGSAITSGIYNVVIGSNTGSSIATASNTVLIADGQGNERMRINSSAHVGIGTTSPVTKLDVAGGVKISMESATCAVSYAGTLRYNAGLVEFCNGTSWSAFGVAGSGITTFNGSTSATQTFSNSLTGTAPLFATLNGVHTLNIPYASAGTTTAGLISNSDYLNFSNKITSSAASIAQVLGYVPASATALANYLLKTNNLSDVASATVARANLGLGGFATVSSLDLGSASATGTLAIARLPAFAGDIATAAGSNTVTVDGLQGRSLLATAPTSGQVLAYNGSAWAPATATAAAGDFLKNGSVSMTGQFRAVTGIASAPSMTFQADLDTGIFNPAANKIGFSVEGVEVLNLSNPNFNVNLLSGPNVTTGSPRALRITPGVTSVIANGNPQALELVGPNYTASYLPLSSGDSGVTIYGGQMHGTANSEGSDVRIMAGSGVGTSSSLDGQIEFYSNDLQRAVIDKDGKFGVGTATPTTNLDVSGTAKISSNVAIGTVINTGATLMLKSFTISTIPLGLDSPAGGIPSIDMSKNGVWKASIGLSDSSSDSLFISNGVSAPIIFDTNNDEKMRITSVGNVGIGTDTPLSPLMVEGSGSVGNRQLIVKDSTALANNVGGAISLGGNSTAGGSYTTFGEIKAGKLNSTSGHLAGYLSFSAHNGTVVSEAMRINYQGYVGVGTTNPQAIFNVSGDMAIGPLGPGFLVTNGNANRNTLGITGNGSSSAQSTGGLYLANNRVTPAANDIAGIISFGSANQGGSSRSVAEIKSVLTGAGGANGFGGAIAFNTKPDNVAAVAEVMRIDADGNVGIGATTPLAKLHIDTGLSTTNYTGIKLQNAFKTWTIGNNVPNNYNNIFSIFDGTASRLWIGDTGNVGIGVINPSYRLDVSGTIRGYGITDSSDIRLKKDIKSLDLSLEKILKVDGVSYYWIDKSIPKKQIGFIAQQLEKVYPELVETDNKGMKSVNYSHLVAPLVEAVKSLYKRIVGVENGLSEVNRQIASIAESKADKAQIEVLKQKADKLESENAAKAEEIDALKSYLCSKDPAAPICK